MHSRLVTLATLVLLGGLGALGVLLWRDRDVLSVRFPVPLQTPPPERPTTPAAALVFFQCNRCHVIPSVTPASAPLVTSCVGCHQGIAEGRFDRWYPDETVARWRSHLVHLVRTPDLATLSRRVRRAWLIDFLQAPHVVRPLGGAMMPRLQISASEAALLADALDVTSSEAPAAPTGDPARGAAVYAARGCATCHERGDAPAPLRYGATEFRDAPEARRRAPDLRWVRVRMTEAQLRAWLMDPRSVQPDTVMPTFAFAPAELDDLMSFLLTPVEARPSVVARAPKRLDREVHYPEVAQRLSSHLCFHCHSDLRRAGDQGPGNTGGFGFSGVRLDLATRVGILRGAWRDGRFVASPDRLDDGMPRLVASLLARVGEVQGQPDPRVLGMPQGLPPLTEDDIDLVFTWLEQGAPE